MTVANAQKFIKRGLTDSELRARLNRAADPGEIQQILEEEDLGFTPGEFDEAYHHALTECQTNDAANQIKEFEGWWDLLFRTF
ncbi:Nitrogen fixation protein of unknown function [Desulfatibacillum alkenivorans DSM 16219]|jgi:hypothetical protein|uniref:Nif11 domain-containing protein n=1 Tax=Desulfatibacillum alkenivorans DSM 16219 TaxID=1121393 RepID=A0A1M6G8F4_9BACT|nr:Nif11-like leader peptide family natural product precursor [Desulfatibacillum alkenivorans]SHJ06285.1 Nitrogen fixation protein of unknown function [Desulfatibacillum alkenivorans DSM 16219]